MKLSYQYISNLVSIIVPMYNAEKYVEDTINSVINQTYTNWEMLIVNDNSTDNSLEIVKKYAKNDSRIKIYNNDKNLGVVKSRNKMIEKSNGQFIAFLDSDDYWSSDKLEKQVSHMRNNNLCISGTSYYQIYENSEKIVKIKTKKELTYTDMLKNNYLGCLTVMYDTSRIGKKYFKEINKNEDYLLWLEILKKIGKTINLEENLAYYRVLSNSRSSNKFEVVKSRWEIYRKYEKLSFVKSCYYLFHYMVNWILKNYKNN